MSTEKPIPIKSMVCVVKSVNYYVLCQYYALDDVFTRTQHDAPEEAFSFNMAASARHE